MVMVDKNRLLIAIHKQIQRLSDEKEKLHYIQQFAHDKAIEELYRLKFDIEQGNYDIRIW
jgi:hypothetical protein